MIAAKTIMAKITYFRDRDRESIDTRLVMTRNTTTMGT